MSSCRTPVPVEPQASPAPAPAPVASASRPAQALAKAVVYKTSAPCADNVAISLNASGSAVQSYPAPSDVNAGSAPLPLANGWWLDRRGIGPNTAFLSLTYAEYSALPKAPSTAQMMEMLLPEVRVTELRRLDMTPQQAATDTAALNAIVRQWDAEE